MLRAIQHGQYYKAGRGKMITYRVTGTKAEIDDYLRIQSLSANKPVDKLPKLEDGSPLFFLSESQELANGRAPQPSYNLVKNQDGTRIFRDTTAQDQQMYARLNDGTEKEMAKILAERRLGIGTTPTTTRTITQPTPQPAGDPIAELIEAGGELEAAPIEAGTETLGQ